MRDFTFQESEDGEILMGGMLTIENAAAVRSALLKTLRRRNQITITVAEDAVTDLSFLQILCSMHRTAIGAAKAVRLGRFSATFVSAIVNAGFARHRGCTSGTENNCLWNAGGNK